jgi:hypothetical protein
MNTLTEYFITTWARSLEDFVEAERNSPFHLESRTSDKYEEEMEEFVLKEKNIPEVIKSRED